MDPEKKVIALTDLAVWMRSSIIAKNGLKGCSISVAKRLVKEDWNKSLDDYVGPLGFANEIELIGNLTGVRLDYNEHGESCVFPEADANNVDDNRIIDLIERTNKKKSKRGKPMNKGPSWAGAPSFSRPLFAPRRASNDSFATFGKPYFQRRRANNNNSAPHSSAKDNFQSPTGTPNRNFSIRGFNRTLKALGVFKDVNKPAPPVDEQRIAKKSPNDRFKNEQPPKVRAFGRGRPSSSSISNRRNFSLHRQTPSYSLPANFSGDLKYKDAVKEEAGKSELFIVNPGANKEKAGPNNDLDDFDSRVFASVSSRDSAKGRSIADAKKLFLNDWKKPLDQYVKAFGCATELELLRRLKKVRVEWNAQEGVYYIVPIIAKIDSAAQMIPEEQSHEAENSGAANAKGPNFASSSGHASPSSGNYNFKPGHGKCFNRAISGVINEGRASSSGGQFLPPAPAKSVVVVNEPETKQDMAKKKQNDESIFLILAEEFSRLFI